jgi:dipeptidyl aminopeptidase/acylaminoacyl peptidase
MVAALVLTAVVACSEPPPDIPPLATATGAGGSTATGAGESAAGSGGAPAAPVSAPTGGEASPSGTAPTPGGGLGAERPTGLTVVPESLSWAPDGRRLAYGTREGQVFFGGDSDFFRIEDIQMGPSARPFARWSPDGSRLLIGGPWFETGQVYTGLWIYEYDSGAVEVVVPPSQVISPVEGNTGAVHDAEWSPDGTRFAFPYRGEAWLGEPGREPVRLTHLTDEPIDRGGGAPFDGVRFVRWHEGGSRLALELSCACGAPWSGAAVLEVDESGRAGEVALLEDGVSVSGWSADGRLLGQNSVDWSPLAIVDGYAVDPVDGETENLTESVAGRDPLAERELGSAPPDAEPPPFQTGPVHWGPDGTLLYELFTYGDQPLPHRGYAVRAAGGATQLLPGSAELWLVGPRLLDDGSVVHVEAEPGPAMALTRAVRSGEEIAALDGLAAAVSFAPGGDRLAVVESSASGEPIWVRVIALP